MKLLSGLTIKGLTYAVLVLAIISVTTTTGWVLHARALGKQLDAAQTQATREAVNTDSAVGANDAWKATAEKAILERDACQTRETLAATDAQAVLAQAQRAELAAATSLAEFDQRWAARSLHCGEALVAMEKACPAFKDY